MTNAAEEEEDQGFEVIMPTGDRHVRWSDAHLSEFYRQFKAHADRLEDHMTQEEKQLSALADAFPNRDPIEHRKYHEKLMEAADAQKQFWQELRLDVAKKSVWGVLIVVITLIGWAILEKLKIHVGAAP